MSNYIIKKRSNLFVFICILLLLLCGCSANDKISYSSGNITDSDFEGIRLNKYWRITDKKSVSIDSGISHTGEKSLKIGNDGSYTAGITQYIDGLKPGYYYLEAFTQNEGNQNYCYIYGNGTNQGQCMTAIPVITAKGTWTKVTVRGIEVGEDGILELGMCAEGKNQYVYFDSLSLNYENNQDQQYEALFGGAISWLDWVEDLGGKYYYSDKTEGDALQIMSENGCNFVRLELYNNPGDYVNELGETFPKGYKDADSIYGLAVRAHNKDMKIQLSFMYSDYWGNDAIPSDWLAAIEGVEDKEKITEILTECIYNYTKAFMERLSAAGIYPEYVSLGNEMEAGILTPYGASYTDDGDISAFCSFMDAGYRAVKEVSPNSQVVLHISCNANDMLWEQKSGMGKWFFNICKENDITYDVIGISFYPFWAQTDDKYAIKKALDTADFVEWCNMMIDEYDKDILIMESAINWGTPGQLSDNGAYTGIYPYTPEGQRDYMYEFLNAVKCVKDGRCVGSLYWDPVLVKQEGIGYAVMNDDHSPCPNVVETTTFFDYDHIALPVLNAYKYNTVGTSTAVLYGTIAAADQTPFAEKTFTIHFNGNDYTVTTDRYGTYYTHIASGNGTLSINDQPGQEISITAGQNLNFNFIIQE